MYKENRIITALIIAIVILYFDVYSISISGDHVLNEKYEFRLVPLRSQKANSQMSEETGTACQQRK
jgi:hypothetical protein